MNIKSFFDLILRIQVSTLLCMILLYQHCFFCYYFHTILIFILSLLNILNDLLGMSFLKLYLFGIKSDSSLLLVRRYHSLWSTKFVRSNKFILFLLAATTVMLGFTVVILFLIFQFSLLPCGFFCVFLIQTLYFV